MENYEVSEEYIVTAETFATIEACLFAAGHPLTYSRLGEVLETSAERAADIVEKMAAIYNDESAHRGIILVRFPDSCQLCTKEKYASDIKTALGMKRGGNLSQSLLEVLAVIAYNQPSKSYRTLRKARRTGQTNTFPHHKRFSARVRTFFN